MLRGMRVDLMGDEYHGRVSCWNACLSFCVALENFEFSEFFYHREIFSILARVYFISINNLLHSIWFCSLRQWGKKTFSSLKSLATLDDDEREALEDVRREANRTIYGCEQQWNFRQEWRQRHSDNDVTTAATSNSIRVADTPTDVKYVYVKRMRRVESVADDGMKKFSIFECLSTFNHILIFTKKIPRLVEVSCCELSAFQQCMAKIELGLLTCNFWRSAMLTVLNI